jgi:tRNA A-37 threonylcarbamoyl transferase component Bud32
MSWVEFECDLAGAGLFVKRQRNYLCRPLWSLGRAVPTVRRELRALKALAARGIAVPEILGYDERDGICELRLAAVENASPFDEALRRNPNDAHSIAGNVAGVVARLHALGWNHGALYPKHVLVQGPPDYRVTLIDLEKASRSWWHASDLDRLLRYTEFPTPELAHWFEECYARDNQRAGAQTDGGCASHCDQFVEAPGHLRDACNASSFGTMESSLVGERHDPAVHLAQGKSIAEGGLGSDETAPLDDLGDE